MPHPQFSPNFFSAQTPPHSRSKVVPPRMAKANPFGMCSLIHLAKSALAKTPIPPGQAIRDGVNLHGYFIWSIVDNFEWNSGYSKRFGLVYVGHANQQRFIKDSGRWVAELI